jgi:hypothetical protein
VKGNVEKVDEKNMGYVAEDILTPDTCALEPRSARVPLTAWAGVSGSTPRRLTPSSMPSKRGGWAASSCALPLDLTSVRRVWDAPISGKEADGVGAGTGR